MGERRRGDRAERPELAPFGRAERVDRAEMIKQRDLCAAAEVLSEDSTNLPARLIRAQAFVNMAEPEKARQELATALQTHPASNESREQLAELDFREHRYKDAEEGFRALCSSR